VISSHETHGSRDALRYEYRLRSVLDALI